MIIPLSSQSATNRPGHPAAAIPLSLSKASAAARSILSHGSRSATSPLLPGPAPGRGGALRARSSGPSPATCRAVAEEQEQGAPSREKNFSLGAHAGIQVHVTESHNGDQTIRLSTNLEAGRLLLHWGVEQERISSNGWRLPGESAWPQGTKSYKDRALQTPFVEADGALKLTMHFPASESADRLNFVLKDAATCTWYDDNGDNFSLGLHPGKPSLASMDEPTLLDKDELPNLPQELCNVWAYLGWQEDGCPERSNEESEHAFRQGVKEMQAVLRVGIPLDDLWAATKDGTYGKYRATVVSEALDAVAIAKDLSKMMSAPPAEAQTHPDTAGSSEQQQQQHVEAPTQLVHQRAYLMWDESGRPDGADFGHAAREELEAALRGGATVESLADLIRHQRNKLDEREAAAQAAAQEAAELEAVAQAAAQQQQEQHHAPKEAAAPDIGTGLDVAERDPLELIKTVPTLSSDKNATRAARPLEPLVQAAALDDDTKWRRLFPMGEGNDMLITVAEAGSDGPLTVVLTTDIPSPILMHWGVSLPSKARHEWVQPDPQYMDLPAGSLEHEGKKAIETPFKPRQVEGEDTTAPLQSVTLTVPADHGMAGLKLVLRSEDGTRWWNNGSGDFSIPLPGGKLQQEPEADPLEGVKNSVLRAIVEAENSSAWTLMHRFNKTAELLHEIVNGSPEGDLEDCAAAIFVWLRYSATRQLTWQRNYNTQPRHLSGSQDNCTGAIVHAAAQLGGEAGEWVRASLACVGRGGDGQKIRDEILNIMHRHHIGEKREYWIEEWHQKLHNNTTPDDIPICEAYIAFLEGGGDNGAYWRVLSDAGISRERMEGFDRPITKEPEHYGVDTGAFIHDLRGYLSILKNVHSGADLQASARAAGDSLPGSAQGYVGYVLSHVGDSQVLPLMQAAVEARTEIRGAIPGNRELMYLDLALEEQVRQCAERGSGAAGFGSAAFVGPLLQNLCLSLGDNEELCYCLKAWQALPSVLRSGGRPARDEALRASAVVDRIRRSLASVSDRVSARITPLATSMGGACGVEEWVSQLFAEEVVRGGPAFAVSLVLSQVEPVLRNAAELGAWQVISPQDAVGRVVVVDGLHEVQDDVYPESTVLVAAEVSGEEEIPEGVVALLSPDAPDVLSHVSVRARNMKVLFATCHDQEELARIREACGSVLSVAVTAAGSVTWEGVGDEALQHQDGGGSNNGAAKPRMKVKVPKWNGSWAVNMDDMKEGVVGSKSRNLAALRGKLPEAIKLPSSVTLPFGTFEQGVLNAPGGKAVKTKLKKALDSVSTAGPAKALAAARAAIMEVQVPDKLQEALKQSMEAAGIPVPSSPERWEAALAAIKGVWASKYNDRAYYSMRKIGFTPADLRMAVLCQRVVPADYAFVIHTRNPTNDDDSEIFCEMVKGLGESLVSGTVPGSSLTFVAKKDNTANPSVLTYPSKSEGMFVPESLIFRSDSNGEDLEGYAGAGLYESITMDTTELARIDMSSDPLMVDEGFRADIMRRVCEVGLAIEHALGSAQDIEGVIDPDGNITVVQTRPQV